MGIPEKILFYRDCYNADNRSIQITNIYSTKIENKFFIEDKEELLNNELPYIPLDEDYAAKVKKNLMLYPKEKALYYCSFFITGKRETSFSNESRICAPVLLIPAEIQEINGFNYLSINVEKTLFNIGFLNQLKKDHVSDLYTTLNKLFNEGFIYERDLTKIVEFFESELEDIDASSLYFFPKLHDEKELKKGQNYKIDSYKGVPSSLVCVVRKPTNTYGVSSELAEIAKGNTFSKPVKGLFLNQAFKTRKSFQKGTVPVILNKDQEGVIKKANENVLSMVIGPPGTGKSFTIAALSIELVSKGKSVLVVSRNNQAVDVVGDKIEEGLEVQNLVLRAGKKSYLKELKSRIENILSGAQYYQLVESVSNGENPFKDQLNSTKNDVKKLEGLLKKALEKELVWGKKIYQNEGQKGIIQGLVHRYLEWRTKSNKQLTWSLYKRLFERTIQKTELSKKFILWEKQYQLDKLLLGKRKTLISFLKALKARTSSRRMEMFNKADFNTILDVFPIWLCSLSDLYNVLPLKPELFDYVIIDEATQCDIATCIPALQRARNTVIVGDPKQLRHVSFLSKSIQHSLQQKYELNNSEVFDYREKSILDVAFESIESQDSVSFLHEHFRSTPQIIGFSNRYFYNDSLKIMTSLPDHQISESVKYFPVNGSRNKKGINETEANEIINKVSEIVIDQKDLDKAFSYRIGILSPFRDQVEFLSTQINKKFTVNELEKHELVCGTAYEFQGDERDIMFISFCVDDKSHPSAFRHISRNDVFNVSITRARNYQYVYHSIKNNGTAGNILSNYLNHNPNIRKFEVSKSNRDPFLNDVFEYLNTKDIKIWRAYEFAGVLIDLMVKSRDRFYGIDLIGYPGSFEEHIDIYQYKLFNRIGIPVFPLPYSQWNFQREIMEEELSKYIEVV